MGFFKQLKDSKALISAAPGMIDQANQMAAAARQAQVSNLAAMEAMAPGATHPSTEQLAPIAGVDLPTYAWVSKQIAAHGYDQSLLPEYAAQRGISAADWTTAMHGWGARMNDRSIATAFRRYYDQY